MILECSGIVLCLCFPLLIIINKCYSTYLFNLYNLCSIWGLIILDIIFIVISNTTSKVNHIPQKLQNLATWKKRNITYENCIFSVTKAIETTPFKQ